MNQSDTVWIIRPGDKIEIGSLTAIVIGSLIRESSVEYEISWWTAGDRKTAWIREIEIINTERNLQVGFAHDRSE